MLDELKFVKGGVSKKGLIPTLTHFRIENGTVRSFNGTLALSSPIKLDLDCTPKAEPFVKAIQNCTETVSLSMTPAGRLSIKSGAFKAFIECVDTETPHVVPEGEEFPINGEDLLKALKTISPFIGNDASRPWSNGILIKGQSAYATNNVSLIEYWIGDTFPLICNVSRDAVKEMIRINEAPERVQINDHSISFHYPDGKWIRSALLDIGWPNVEKIIDVPAPNVSTLSDELFDALENIKPFVDKLERVYMGNGFIGTTLIEKEGASYALEDFPHEGVYQLSVLRRLKGIATSIDFTQYPRPCPFYGDRLRGVLIGMKV